jgi:outer membrane receptor protein involved in Fe transport
MKLHLMKIRRLVLISCVLWATLMMPSTSGRLLANTYDPDSDDTMLMFVGMDLDVLTIASRRQESASQAPAIAEVITRDQMQESGYSSLAEMLGMTPGFYMAPKEWGSQPYMRGLQNSVLFLYDTVPMHSNIDKTVHPIDHELSPASVKRLEIIRGPGSVLWGPDAYTGIVNIVPMSGKDVNGVETGALYNSHGDQAGGWLNAGKTRGPWDMFFSASGRYGREDERRFDFVEFWNSNGRPVSPEDRFGRGRPENSRYMEMTGRLGYGDVFSLSGRFSDFKKPYTVEARDAGTWSESRSTPFSFVKAEGKKDLDVDSAVRFMGYYSSVRSTYEVIDNSYSPNEYTWYAEMIYDRRFLAGRSLFTGGVSYRDRRVNDAPVWDSYLPRYLGADNISFLPSVRQIDYDNTLRSAFAQYSHKFGKIDIFIGGRLDDHEAYADNFSFNTGIVWPFNPRWQIKLLYGTAYRTPFARQLMEEKTPDLEEIDTFNAQLTWKPSASATLKAAAFVSKISDHIMQDPYAGLSEPNDQTLRGLEISGEFNLKENLNLAANATFIDNNGPDETYQYLAYSYIRPDGSIEDVFEDISYPFETGPKMFANLVVRWRPMKNLGIFTRLSYARAHDLVFPRGEIAAKGEDFWNLDINALFEDVLQTKTDLNLSFRNVFDRQSRSPGTYEMISTQPFTVEVMLKKKWD